MWSIDKVQFTCPNCSEKINITIENLKDRENVQCPNCRFDYPNKLIQLINDSVSKVVEAYVLVKNDSNLDGLEFDFIPVFE